MVTLEWNQLRCGCSMAVDGEDLWLIAVHGCTLKHWGEAFDAITAEHGWASSTDGQLGPVRVRVAS